MQSILRVPAALFYLVLEVFLFWYRVSFDFEFESFVFVISGQYSYTISHPLETFGPMDVEKLGRRMARCATPCRGVRGLGTCGAAAG